MLVCSRTRGQSTVEFGAIAIVFALMMFAIVDFGILLNGWINVAADARAVARDAAVGAYQSSLDTEAQQMHVPGVSVDSPTFDEYCCGDTGGHAALVMSVTFYKDCISAISACTVLKGSQLDSRYGTPPNNGTCSSTCLHPARPRPAGVGDCPGPAGGPACAGDLVVVTLTAASAQVITPLVRPFFCGASTAPHCYVTGIASTVAMRFEGTQL
jgi:hypothetical protein